MTPRKPAITERRTTMDHTSVAIGQLQAAQQAMSERQDRAEATTEARFQVIDGKLNTADAKLDTLIEAHRVTTALRHEAEKRQDQRAKKIAGWSSLSTGVIVALVAETARWILFHKIGVHP